MPLESLDRDDRLRIAEGIREIREERGGAVADYSLSLVRAVLAGDGDATDIATIHAGSPQLAGLVRAIRMEIDFRTLS